MTRKRSYFLALLSGILFVLSWPPLGFPFILFIAFVPLLMIEHAFSSGQTTGKRATLFGLSYLTFFIWNVITTFWVCNASLSGGIMAIFSNSFIMAAVIWIFHIVKKRLLTANLPVRQAGWALPTVNWLFAIFWLGYEFFHHNWDLTWPWLGLGNAFASVPSCIQWYEYTGTCGGTLWVLAVNLMILGLFKSGRSEGVPSGLADSRWKLAGIVFTIITPIIISVVMYRSYKENPDPINIVIVQPNIDPYSEKFDGMNFEEQLEKMLDLAAQKVDSSTDYLVCPETALTESMWENDMEGTVSIRRLKSFIKPFPKLKIVVGASTSYMYDKNEKLSVTARKFTQQDDYYDSFNTAMQIDSSDVIQVYHKSKLVPGVERMPYPAVFGFLEDLAIDLGGTAGSLGIQEEREVFKAPPRPSPLGREAVPKVLPERQVELGSAASLGGASIAPVICYESIFGEFVNQYVHKGATSIFIITNDGWWGNTLGFEQHLIYGRLRAIETRRSIARSANTGISCFINQRGDILQRTGWWVPDVIKGSINSNSEETFYVRNGDIIWRVSFYVSMLVLIFVFSSSLRDRFGAKQSRS